MKAGVLMEGKEGKGRKDEEREREREKERIKITEGKKEETRGV